MGGVELPPGPTTTSTDEQHAAGERARCSITELYVILGYYGQPKL